MQVVSQLAAKVRAGNGAHHAEHAHPVVAPQYSHLEVDSGVVRVPWDSEVHLHNKRLADVFASLQKSALKQ